VGRGIWELAAEEEAVAEEAVAEEEEEEEEEEELAEVGAEVEAAPVVEAAVAARLSS
jgi:hypothetical protein